MRIPIAKEGYPFILIAGVLTGISAALAPFGVTGIFAALLVFVIAFFRDPERTIPEDPKIVVSPGDGKVVEITTEVDPFMGKTFTRVSVFLSVFNVHVNRMPIGGKIEKIQYNKGKFLAAFNEKSSMDNEQSIMLIRNGEVEVLVKQIAGLIARRIVCWPKEGDVYELGQRYGLIRFGSRMDVLVPESTRLTVSLGDHVKGGISPIGYLA